MVSIEDAEWSPKFSGGAGQNISESLKLLRSLRPGDVKRLVHGDVSCVRKAGQGYRCSLAPQMTRLRHQGWKLESYHEVEHIVVIRRSA